MTERLFPSLLMHAREQPAEELLHPLGLLSFLNGLVCCGSAKFKIQAYCDD
jgi:hypothetical protein